MWKFTLLLFFGYLHAGSGGLQNLWQQEIQKTDFSEDSQLLAGKHVLFVSGLMNDLIDLVPIYFFDNQDSVENELGGEASRFGSPSKYDIQTNARNLNQHVRKLYEQQRKPIILVGHSKGAAEILHAILKYPDLILDGLVDRVILIQATIQGSPLANDPARWLGWNVIQTLTGVETKSLSEVGAKQILDDAFKQFERQIEPDEREIVSCKIHYVRSALNPEEHCYGVKIILGITQHDPEECSNDGFVAADAQMDPRIGVDLGVVRADHMSLVIPWISGLSKIERKAFTRSVFKLVHSYGT